MKEIELIRIAIKRAIEDLKLPSETIPRYIVEHPADESNGDYATNIAMQCFKVIRDKYSDGSSIGRHQLAVLANNPRELALKITEKLTLDIELKEIIDFSKIQVLGPGFINFWLRNDYLVKKLNENSLRAENIGESDWMKGKRVLVEYSSPNIAKRFSVGHLRSTIIGQAIFNLYKYSGAKVTNDNHLGDWGTQFGMIIAAIEMKPDFDWSTADVNILEQIYVDFNKQIEEKPELRDKAREAFARLENGDKEARAIWQKSIEISMLEFEKIYNRLGIPKFEHEYGESIYEKAMPAIIQEAKEKKITTESQGAWIVEFPDLPPAILLKSNGTTTYFTRDLATIRKRLDDNDLRSDQYIYEVGAEQTLHFRQVFAAAKMLWPKETKGVNFAHVAHGLMTFGGEKMSTRKGTNIKLEDLIFKSGEIAEEKSAGRVSKENSDKVGLGALKYNELKRSPGMNYDFKWDEALAMTGNSAPYLMYSYVRAKSILSKKTAETSDYKEFNGEESRMVRWLNRFLSGEIIESAAKNFGPQLICEYLFELAQRFSIFYEKNKVIDSGGETEEFRLLLTKVYSLVMKRGLEVLGIDVVEKM